MWAKVSFWWRMRRSLLNEVLMEESELLSGHQKVLECSYSACFTVVDDEECRANSTVVKSSDICLISSFCRLISQVVKSG